MSTLAQPRCWWSIYGWYCWSNAQTVSMCTRIQTPVSSGSNNSTGFSPLTSCASSETGDRRRSEVGRVTLPRQHSDVRVRRHEVGQETMTFLDAVVVVRNRLARLDHAVLGGRRVRGDAAREPRRIEAHLVLVAFLRQGRDVAEDPVAALLRGGRLDSASPCVKYRAAKAMAATVATTATMAMGVVLVLTSRWRASFLFRPGESCARALVASCPVVERIERRSDSTCRNGVAMRPEGFEPSTSRSGGARSIP